MMDRLRELSLVKIVLVLQVLTLKKQVRRGTYRESENLLRSIDIW